MKKKLMRRVLSVAASAALVLIAVPIIPMEVKADYPTGAKFVQEIKINDLSDHLHEKNITAPQLTFTYFFDPVVDDSLLPSNGRYQVRKEHFPAGDTNPDSYKGKKKTVTVDSKASDSNGIISADIDLDSVFSTATWGEANKIYRYALSIENVAIGDAADTEHDVRTADNGLFSDGDATIYCDVDVDQNREVRVFVFHTDPTSTDIDDKVDGFVKKADLALSYNVYDVVVSSNTIGTGSNFDSVLYSLTLTNLPDYLTQDAIAPNLTSGTAAREYDVNRQGWTAVTPAEDNKATFQGHLSRDLETDWHETIPGIPVVGDDGSPVKFNTTANYNSLATPDNYNSTIYVGGNAAPITSQITSIDLFRAWTSFGDYGNADDTDKVTVTHNSTTHTAKLAGVMSVQASTSANANNVRFVIFDPASMKLVGVVMNALPAIILIAIAGVGGVLLFRRKKAE